MRIYPINSYANISHRGCLTTEFIPQKYQNQGISTWLIQESAFFRDLPLLEKVRDYLKLKNKPISNIVSGACSAGFELLSMKMLAEEAGLKVNCLGYDIGERVVNKANSFNYTIAHADKSFGTDKIAGYSDSFLMFTNPENMTEQQKKLKTLFNKYFITYPNAIYPPTLACHSLSTEVELKEEERHNVKFVQGNLLEMDSFVPANSVDVFFFKNAMYHLTLDEQDMPKTRGELKDILEKVAIQIEKAVVKDGIFVLGDLWRDHYSDAGIETYKALEKHGFEPAFKTSIWIKR